MGQVKLYITRIVYVGSAINILLSRRMRGFVEVSGQGYDDQVRRVYLRRIVKYAQQALKDLELLARRLPEDRLAQLFHEESLSPLVDAILSGSGGSSSAYVADGRRFSLAALLATRGLAYAEELIVDPIVMASIQAPPCAKENAVLAIWQSLKRK